ncbi:HNH endonuclease [Yoonia sp. 2307UL14-13]|uniref:HNH endonuclease n=1 Tax=Yoonia sp. 2307UL14-13 TaxID=3126506 RepID=UPI003096522F
MSRTLNEQGYTSARQELNDIAAERARNISDAELDAAQMALGAAGLLDPSPTADGVNAGISLARGDYFGFFLDGVSAVPYVGDLVAKPVRGVQMGIRGWARGRRLAAFGRRGAELVDNIRTMRQNAANAVKEARRRVCRGCNNAYGTKTPTRGDWADPDNPGNGTYTTPPRADGTTSDYKFKDGYPDFDDDSMKQYLHPDAKNGVSIEMTGTRRHDDELANTVSGFDRTPDGYTWHHGDDGTSMYLVQERAHADVIPHTGGHNIAADPLF